MSSLRRFAGVVLLGCVGLTGCTGKQILSMRQRAETPAATTSTPAGTTTPASTFTGPAIAATTDYPKNPDAPRPEPPAQFASLKTPLTATPENVAKGKAIYDANCQVCHGAGGGGDGPAGASLNPKPANFKTPIHTRLPDGYWFWRVAKGGTVPPFTAAGSGMLPWEGSLSEQQRWLVILYEHTFAEQK